MKKTIKRALEELKKETPDISYIRGMLEVLVDEDEPYKTYITGSGTNIPLIVSEMLDNTHIDEEITPVIKVGPIGKLNA